MTDYNKILGDGAVAFATQPEPDPKPQIKIEPDGVGRDGETDYDPIEVLEELASSYQPVPDSYENVVDEIESLLESSRVEPPIIKADTPLSNKIEVEAVSLALNFGSEEIITTKSQMLEFARIYIEFGWNACKSGHSMEDAVRLQRQQAQAMDMDEIDQYRRKT